MFQILVTARTGNQGMPPYVALTTLSFASSQEADFAADAINKSNTSSIYKQVALRLYKHIED